MKDYEKLVTGVEEVVSKSLDANDTKPEPEKAVEAPVEEVKAPETVVEAPVEAPVEEAKAEDEAPVEEVEAPVGEAETEEKDVEEEVEEVKATVEEVEAPETKEEAPAEAPVKEAKEEVEAPVEEVEEEEAPEDAEPIQKSTTAMLSEVLEALNGFNSRLDALEKISKSEEVKAEDEEVEVPVEEVEAPVDEPINEDIDLDGKAQAIPDGVDDSEVSNKPESPEPVEEEAPIEAPEKEEPKTDFAKLAKDATDFFYESVTKLGSDDSTTLRRYLTNVGHGIQPTELDVANISRIISQK